MPWKVELLPLPDLLRDRVDPVDELGRQDEVGEATVGMPNVRQRPFALAVGRRRRQRDGLGECRLAAANDDLAQISRERKVVLGLFAGDDLLRRAAEGQLISLPVRPE